MLKLNADIRENMVTLADGNPGAAVALVEMCRDYVKIDPYSAWQEWTPLINFDDKQCNGSQIWIFWKDLCNTKILNAVLRFRGYQMGLLSSVTAYTEKIDEKTYSFLFDKLRHELGSDFARGYDSYPTEI